MSSGKFEYRQSDFIDESVGWSIFSYWDSIEKRVNSIITKSVDSGLSWTIQKKYEDYEIWEIFVVDDSVVYVLGGKYDSTTERFEGEIWKTSDGGSNWIDISPDLTDKHLSEIWFFNPDYGIICGSYYDGKTQMGLILKTYDGGTTWDTVFENNIDSLGYNFFCKQIGFINEDIGYTVGSGILKTSDGGENWNLVWVPPHSDEYNYGLNSVHTVNNTAWAVGGNGLVLRTKDGVSWVDQNTGRKYPNKFSLSQNYPNPFNPITIINYELRIMLN